MNDRYLNEFIAQYIRTALWSCHDDDGRPLDATFGTDSIGESARAAMAADCAAFIQDNQADLEGIDPGQAGHDFWLTRNGHGAGFWDRGLGAVGDRLTEASQRYPEIDLWIGDDGLYTE